jgi:hypothetical protein
MSNQRNPYEDLKSYQHSYVRPPIVLFKTEHYLVEMLPFYIQEYIKYQELKERLKEIEWQIDFHLEEFYCPVCQNLRENGHKSDCWLAAEIGGE